MMILLAYIIANSAFDTSAPSAFRTQARDFAQTFACRPPQDISGMYDITIARRGVGAVFRVRYFDFPKGQASIQRTEFIEHSGITYENSEESGQMINKFSVIGLTKSGKITVNLSFASGDHKAEATYGDLLLECLEAPTTAEVELWSKEGSE